MGTIDYLTKAKESEKLLIAIAGLKSRNLDWEVIITFYTALQYVDAFLKGKLKLKYEDHGTRNSLIEKHLERIWPEYSQLYGDGRKARYIAEFRPNPFRVWDYENTYLLNIKEYIRLRLE